MQLLGSCIEICKLHGLRLRSLGSGSSPPVSGLSCCASFLGAPFLLYRLSYFPLFVSPFSVPQSISPFLAESLLGDCLAKNFTLLCVKIQLKSSNFLCWTLGLRRCVCSCVQRSFNNHVVCIKTNWR